MDVHVYQPHEAGFATEELSEEEDMAAANHWILPSVDFLRLWENLIFDEDIKNNVCLLSL